MVTMETAEKALKTVYLGVVANQLNVGVNPLLAKIRQTTSDVWGKEIVKLVPYGLNGGIGAGTETGDLPAAAANNYDRFRLELKNLYGTIELSDKAIRASQSSVGAFVNLLDAEMEGLLKASKFNLGRMLYGDGSGKIATITAQGGSNNKVVVSSVKNLMEGMVVDVYDGSANTVRDGLKGVRITSVDRATKTVTFGGVSGGTVSNGDYMTVQGSKDNELTGLGAIFSDKDLYGLSRSGREWMKSGSKSDVGGSVLSAPYIRTQRQQKERRKVSEYHSFSRRQSELRQRGCKGRRRDKIRREVRIRASGACGRTGRRSVACGGVKEGSMKEKIKSYDFWMAIASAVFVALQAVGFTTEIPYLQEITTAFLGLLAVSGLIVKPPKKQEQESVAEEITTDVDNNEEPEQITDIIDKIIDNTN